MANPVDIVINARDNASPIFEKMAGNSKTALDKTAQSTQGLAERTTYARESIMAFSGAVSVLQNSLGNNLSPELKKVFDGFGTISSAAMIARNAMPLSGMAGPILGAELGILALLAGAFVDLQAKADAAAENLVKPFKDMRAELDALTKESPMGKLSKDLGVSAEAMTLYAKSSPAATNSLQNLNDAQARVSQQEDKLATAKKKLAEAEADVAKTQKDGIVVTDSQRKLVEYYARQVAVATDVLTIRKNAESDLAQEVRKDVFVYDDQIQRSLALAASNKTAADTEDYFARHINSAQNALKLETDQLLATQAVLKEYSIAVEKAASTAYQTLAGTAIGQLKSVVTQSISVQSTVTQEDLDATKLGKYKDKPDEFRLRLEAIAQGTDPSSYGSKFSKFFSTIDMDAAKAAEGMKDFTFYADPKNLAAFAENGGLDPITQDVEKQIDGIIGKSELMKEAMKKISPDKLAALAKANLTPWEDLQKNELALKIAKDPAFDSVLAQARASVLDTFPKEMQSTILLNYAFAAGATYGNSGNSGSGVGAGAGLKGNNNIEMQAEGGYGIARQGQLFMADAGEAYWFSGKNHTVPPPASVGGNQTIVLTVDGNTLAKVVVGKVNARK